MDNENENLALAAMSVGMGIVFQMLSNALLEEGVSPEILGRAYRKAGNELEARMEDFQNGKREQNRG